MCDSCCFCVLVVSLDIYSLLFLCVFFFQAEDGIRDLVRSRGLGDVYKRQGRARALLRDDHPQVTGVRVLRGGDSAVDAALHDACLLYTSDAADERSSVDLGGRRIIKKKTLTKVEQSDRLIK